MNMGLTPAEEKFLHEKVISPIKNLGMRVYLFGSRARGDFQKFSDIDLLICSNAIQISNDIKRLISKINEFMVNSNFPYKIDFVLEEELAKSYKDKIDLDKIQI